MAADEFQGVAADRPLAGLAACAPPGSSLHRLPISSSIIDCESLRPRTVVEVSVSGCSSRVNQGGQTFPDWEFGDREDWKRNFH